MESGYYKEKFQDAIGEGIGQKDEKSWQELFGNFGEIGKYRKTVAIISMIAKIAPGFVSRKTLEMIPTEDPNTLPFNLEELDFSGKIGSGGEHKVFLLKSKDEKNPSYVLKINFQNHGHLDNIIEKAGEFKKEFEELRDIYSDIPGLIPDEMTIVISHPKNKKPAMATVQKFLGKNLRDVITGFKEEELLSILRENPKLRGDLVQFYEITMRRYKSNESVADLLGENNLSVVENKDGYSLVFLDPHSSIKKDEPIHGRHERLKEYLEKIGSVCEKSV